MITHSVLMTVYNREKRVLDKTLSALKASVEWYWENHGKHFGDQLEIIVVDDGSTMKYPHYDWLDWHRINKDPDCYSIDGTNNPARAWNWGLSQAKGDIIICLASDCIIPKRAIAAASVPGEYYWNCRVVDQVSNMEFLGKKRVKPYGWFMSWDRTYADVRWDENYMKGIAFEDNDMSARLAQATDGVEIDLSLTVTHQTHKQIAYSDDLVGHTINETYTREKWGGIPWDHPSVLQPKETIMVSVK